VLDGSGLQIGFLGGADDQDSGDGAIDREAWQSLMDLARADRRVGDARRTARRQRWVLRPGPGIAAGHEIVERTQPFFHVAGHLHLVGPRAYGRTTSLCLGDLPPSLRWQPEARGLEAGCLGCWTP